MKKEIIKPSEIFIARSKGPSEIAATAFLEMQRRKHEARENYLRKRSGRITQGESPQPPEET